MKTKKRVIDKRTAKRQLRNQIWEFLSSRSARFTLTATSQMQKGETEPCIIITRSAFDRSFKKILSALLDSTPAEGKE